MVQVLLAIFAGWLDRVKRDVLGFLTDVALILIGACGPGGSYRHSPLSLQTWRGNKPYRPQTLTVEADTYKRSAISSRVSMPLRSYRERKW